MANLTVNNVTLLGKLAGDPELRSTASGNSVCTLRLITYQGYKNDMGEWEDRPSYHNVVLWGRTAEVAEQYLRKGRRVYIEGSLQTRSYEDRDGNKRWITEVKGRRMIMVGGGPDERDTPGREPRDRSGRRHEERRATGRDNDYGRERRRGGPDERDAPDRKPRDRSGSRREERRSTDRGGWSQASRTEDQDSPAPPPEKTWSSKPNLFDEDRPRGGPGPQVDEDDEEDDLPF